MDLEMETSSSLFAEAPMCTTYLKSLTSGDIWPTPAETIQSAFGIPMPAIQPFEYTDRLEGRSVRLIELLPGDGDEEIECHLHQQSLDSAMPFIALSYVWGDPHDTRIIRCGGKRHHITKNLYNALWQIREYGSAIEPALLWADALCINQSDVAEKTEQVRLMAEIYKRAEQVLAWLGEQGEMEKRGTQLIHQLNEFFRARPNPKTYNLNAAELPYLEDLGLPSMEKNDWEGLLNILQNPWFTRVWIIQELVLAQECYFLLGRDFIHETKLLTLALKLEQSGAWMGLVSLYKVPADVHSNAKDLAVLRDRIKRHEDKYSLADLLWVTSSFRSSDPRDKVFALVALAKNVKPDFVNYDRELSEVLLGVATHVPSQIAFDGSAMSMMEMLSYAQIYPQSVSLPSWVPDWTSTPIGYDPMTSVSAYPTIPNKQNFSITLDNALLLRLKVFDRIRCIEVVDISAFRYLSIPRGFLNSAHSVSEIGPTILQSFLGWLHEVETCFNLVQELGSYPTGENLADVLWRSMVFDNDSDAVSRLPEFRRSLHYLREMLVQLQSHASWNDRMDEKLEALLYHQSMSGLYFEVLYISATIISFIWLYKRRKTFSFSFWRFWGWSLVSHIMEPVVVELSWSLFWSLVRLAYKYVRTVCNYHERRTMESLSEIFNGLRSFNCIGRSFCISQDGYVAWVAPEAQPGDEICVFEGSHIPFVVRRVDGGPEGRNNYRLIGDCYVHGRMKQAGEGFPEIASVEGYLV